MMAADTVGLELWDICENRHGGNPESEGANVAAASGKHRDRSIILQHLDQVGDATCDEVEVALGMRHQTCSARFSELKARGEIVAVGKRVTRTGCKATVYKRKP